jgi:NADPH2:quinone reductase
LSIPETFLTAWGTITCLNVKSGDNVLIRGGTSSGMVIAKQMNCNIIATTRNEDKISALKENGADHVVIDNGDISESVKKIFPDGADKIVELVGAATLIDSLKCAKSPGGTVCMTGIFIW